MIQTTNCVKCGKSGVSMIIGGHVHKDKEIITATTCHDCTPDAKSRLGKISMNGCKGCFGQWIPAYGYEKNNYGEVLELSSLGFKKIDL